MPSATFGFLGNPESVDTISSASSYTVPAGKYVWVSGSANGGKIQINSEDWLEGLIEEQTGNIVSFSTNLTVPKTSRLKGWVVTNSPTPAFTAYFTESINNVTIKAESFTVVGSTNLGYYFSYNQIVLSGSTLNLTVAGGVQMRYRLLYYPVMEGQANGQMWCKAGDVIACTNDATAAIAIFPA